MESSDESRDGRLAHHHAVNALARLSQLSRGRYQEMIATYGRDSHDALEARLDAMVMYAKQRHSTNYKEQAAMAALRNCLNAGGTKQ